MEERVIDIFSEVSGYNKELLNKETYVRDTGVNSITIIQIMVKIEQEFGIEIDDEDLDFSILNTINDFFCIISKKYIEP